MSFVVGTLSGALVAGGVYYGFSNLMQTRTKLHQKDLHDLSTKLLAPAATVRAPVPAAERIAFNPVKALLKTRWNEEVGGIFKTVAHWEKGAVEWGRKWLYGGPRP